jgi:hypothetical protein
MLLKLFLFFFEVDSGVPKPSIAILTPYKGQMVLIRQQLIQMNLFQFRNARQSNGDQLCTLSTVDRFKHTILLTVLLIFWQTIQQYKNWFLKNWTIPMCSVLCLQVVMHRMRCKCLTFVQMIDEINLLFASGFKETRLTLF